MRCALFLLTSIVVTAAVLAQERAGADVAPAGKDSRDALIRSALARDRGEITALESSSRDGGGVLLGYSSGALLNCYGEQSCREYEGTPNVAVLEITVSRRDNRDVVWVAYAHGVFYRCVDYHCSRFRWESAE